MEHVPEEEVEEVLADIASYAPNAVFAIALRPAAATLPNGDNAHCTVKPIQWWHGQLLLHYKEVEHIPTNKHFWGWWKCSN